jgi:hypothetical protein
VAYVVRYPHALPARNPNELALPTRIALKVSHPVRVAGIAGLIGLTLMWWPEKKTGVRHL